MNIPEILPCPFCGKQPMKHHAIPNIVCCVDHECGGYVRWWSLELWNRRQPTPEAARELNLKWGRHDGRGEYHIEWHAPCGCAYHPEPKPHVHPCIKHSPIEDALHDLREMWLNFPGLSFGSLSIPCIQEMSPEQADFYEKACEIAKASPAAVSGDKQEKERG